MNAFMERECIKLHMLFCSIILELENFEAITNFTIKEKLTNLRDNEYN